MPFETTRRGFLKLFGMTAGATLIAPEVGKFTSLFGAEKSTSPILGWHTIVKKRPLLGKLPSNGWDMTRITWNNIPVAAISAQFPKDKGESWRQDGWSRVFVDDSSLYSDAGYDEIVVPIPPGVDTHLGFYKAAQEARQKFYDRALEMIQRQPNMRTKLVSVMHQPIYVRPAITNVPTVETRHGREWAEHWNGELEVVCDCETRLLWDPDFTGWDIESEYGEVPIETPTDIDIGVLMHCDHAIVTQTGSLWNSYRNRFLTRRG